MNLKPGEDIGEETHPNIDQFFRFEAGNGKCIINGNEYMVENGDVIVMPASSKHNVINTDAVKELKMYTIYGPPNHKDGSHQFMLNPKVIKSLVMPTNKLLTVCL
jgi:mannose-6-phosphate isomerase-like protein (cupin superfamily)